MIFVGVILSKFASCYSQKCRLQVSAVVLLFKTDLFSKFINFFSVSTRLLWNMNFYAE